MSLEHEHYEPEIDFGPSLTDEPYKCLECGHEGQAMKDTAIDHHGDGAFEETYEPLCTGCGGNRVEEIPYE